MADYYIDALDANTQEQADEGFNKILTSSVLVFVLVFDLGVVLGIVLGAALAVALM